MLWVSCGSCSSSKLMEACALNLLTQPFPFATQSRNWWLFSCCCRIRNWTRGRLGSNSSCVRAAAKVHRSQVCSFPAGFWFVTATSSSSVSFSPWEKIQSIFHGGEARRGDGMMQRWGRIWQRSVSLAGCPLLLPSSGSQGAPLFSWQQKLVVLTPFFVRWTQHLMFLRQNNSRSLSCWWEKTNRQSDFFSSLF